MRIHTLRSRVRWRLVLACALAAVLLALAFVAAQTGYSLLSQADKRDAQLLVLTVAWWTEQCLFWAVLAWAALELIGAARTRLRPSPVNPPVPPHDRSAPPRGRPTPRRSWLASALLTLALLQLLGAADLWLADRPAPLPVDLPRAASNQFRIAAIGGSSTAGFPYERRHAFPALLRWNLEQLFPDREVVVENLAGRGYTLQDAYGALNELEVLPHVLLVYSGHNEFLMRYRLDRAPDERPTFQPSFLGRALQRRINALRQPDETVDNLQLRDVQRPLFDRPVVNRAEWARRERSFRRHLEATVRWCRRHDVLPILVIPAANESAFEPCRSFLPAGFPDDDEARIREIYSQLKRDNGAGAAAPTEPSIAHARYSDLALLTQARDLCPTFAMTWFLLGRAYERAEQYEQARRAYQQALAHDGFPWHATPFADIYRDVAAKHDVPLIDARDVLRPLAPHGILDDHLFHDVLHPSLTAHVAIAGAVLRELRRNALPKPPDQWPETLQPDPDRLANHLQLTPELWARVCDQVARAQLGVPPPHFEADRRRRKADSYSQAAAKLRGGADVNTLSLPGIGYDGLRGTDVDP